MDKETASTELYRVIISGGGTGGHIFPALSIADEIRRRFPKCDIQFVGAEGRAEAKRVPAAGYPIHLLPVRGLSSGGGLKRLFSLIPFTAQLYKSTKQAQDFVHHFDPQVVVGVGGYASAPTLIAANHFGIPVVVQEQNSYAGKANKLVAKKAKCVCTAYPHMRRFFPDTPEIVLTGNPIRHSLLETERKSWAAYATFDLSPDKKTLLILGGSLGAGTINKSILESIAQLAYREDLQVIWQCGESHYGGLERQVRDFDSIHLMPFISEMDHAYAIADLVISRAGAGTISELTALGLPAILVPSPNVAEDHQTHNAQSLVDRGAALMVPDSKAGTDLVPTALDMLSHPEQCERMATAAKELGLPDATQRIVDEIQRYARP